MLSTNLTKAFLALFFALFSVSHAATHQIIVGGGQLQFTPSNITAAVGDLVEFIFMGGQHSVTQSPFGTPCDLLQNATTGAVGFDSDVVAATANSTEFPVWTVEVTAATPIWFFCKVGRHCATGMVGAINAPLTGERSFAAFQALATGNNSTASSGSSTSKANPPDSTFAKTTRSSTSASDATSDAASTTLSAESVSSEIIAETTAAAGIGASVVSAGTTSGVTAPVAANQNAAVSANGVGAGTRATGAWGVLLATVAVFFVL